MQSTQFYFYYLRMDLILGQSDRYVEYNELGQPINNKKKDATKTKYIEDFFIGDHTSVWGSFWNETLGKPITYISYRVGI